MKAMHIGGKLRRLRQERHLSQAQMAAELQISPSYLNLIESNRRPVTARVLLQLADKFKVDVGSLATEDDALGESRIHTVDEFDRGSGADGHWGLLIYMS